jgi:NAD(P)-dependent dehydrogenase (short-subunit alcohol dehydrogenase family)
MSLVLRSLCANSSKVKNARQFVRGIATGTLTGVNPWSAIVTGGAAGIGEAVCKKLASRGINILIADLQAEKGKELVNRLIRDYRVEADYISVDVTKEDDIKDMVTLAVKHWGRLDYAANCAGICIEEEWDGEESITTAAVEK